MVEAATRDWGRIKLCQICRLVMDIKLLIGKNLPTLLRLMGIKLSLEMAQLWPEEISDRTISRALKKIGFTTLEDSLPLRYRKKKLMAIKNALKPNDLNLLKR
ncbi:MAG: hypothetical protein NVS2B14_06150 [Chamaesiphon sp.]